MAQLPLSQALSSPLQATQVTTAASNSTKPCNQWPVALQAFTKTLEVTSLGQGATQHLCQWTRTWEIYGNLWKSPSRNFWSWLFRAYMLCHMHLEKETSLVEHTWSLKLVHWQTTTKHLTLVWTPSSWASQNTPRASCHRPLFSQELMAALKEILCCKANPSPSQHFIPNNLHHLCIGTLVHLCHLTIFNLVKRCKQGWIEARVTSACNASASCKFFKSSNASSHFAASSHALIAALKPITSTP